MDATTNQQQTQAAENKKPPIITAEQPPAPTDYVDMSKQIFHFKTETLRNDKGEEIGKGKKHPSVEIYLPIPKPTKLAEFLLSEGEQFKKERDLLMAAVTDQVYRMARMQINELRDKNAEMEVNQGVIDYAKLDWTAIANLPKAERGAYSPSEEELKAFLDSYLEIMPEAANKSKEKIENHLVCFKTGFKKQRAQKDILEMFKQALAIYVSAAGEELVEEHADVVDYFNGRLDRMLKTEEKITMEDL